MLSHILLFVIFFIQGKGEQCPLGTYGETCDRNCSTQCAPSPSDKAVYCHKLTGKCAEGCNRGWHGDQCNFRCSRNCLNFVCEVQHGTCTQCKVNYTGEYCETYEGGAPWQCAEESAQEVASTPLAAILAPVFILIIIVVVVIITLIVYRSRRSKGRKERMKNDDEGENERLTSVECSNTAAVNTRHQTLDTDLIVACNTGNLQSVWKILKESVDDIDTKGQNGLTPVMWAARKGHRDVVDVLVRKETDVKLVDDVGNNILHWACYGGHVAMVKHVVSKKMVDINRKGQDERTPLMWSARHGKLAMFNLLVSATGKIPEELDRDGDSILHLACKGGNMKIVEYILLHTDVDINARGQSSRTSLMAAAYNGHKELLDMLVSRGADVTLTDHDGNNVLHVACLGGHVDIVRSALEMDKVDINSRGQCSRTPLMMAARMGDKEIFDLLVEGGADATPMDDDSNTILHLASKGENLDIVCYVLSLGTVDMNARNVRNKTAAMLAPNASNVCDLLVKRGGLIQ